MLSLLWLLWVLVGVSPAQEPSALHISGRDADRTAPLDCATDPCAAVLPGAARFEAVEGKPYFAGLDAAGQPAGWVALSTDLVDIPGYSGKAMHTVVGVDPAGVIAGARVVHHSEPILLVGIPEQRLTDFVDAHVGARADERVIVGGRAEGVRSVDVVSGATVTVLAESRTILDTARLVAEDVGVIPRTARVPGHFVEEVAWTWDQLVRRGALGHLRVEQAEMGQPPDPEGRPFLDLWFGVADAPQVGIPLLGEATWRYQVSRLQPGEHLFVVFNAGSNSFKGSGFVRGGLFDRFRLQQGLATVTFRDLDYTRVSSPPVADAPRLPEGGVFLTRDDGLDPGAAYTMVFLGSAYALDRGAFERDFRTFEATHRVPRRIYALDGPDPDSAVWRAAWSIGWPKALFVGLYFLFVGGLFAGRRWMSGRMSRLKVLHTSVLATSFIVVGLLLHVQPSVTQILTLLGTSEAGWDWGLFLSDPVLFVSWIAIALLTIAWGRGVFCGWVCPYGAMNELTFKLGRKLGLPELELPDRVHFKARYLRYGVLAVLGGLFLWDAGVGEMAAEIEPFKSTFLVPIWTRHPGLIAWWLVLFGVSAVTYRPFCRYVCPLGAALAVPSSARISGPYRRDFCSKCKICTRGCEPRAIRPDGTIDPRECLNCWECEANWRDDQVCPPLVKARRDRERGKVSA
jgi:NosR/NirI family nitrous oxide reductase transcriptional regulator